MQQTEILACLVGRSHVCNGADGFNISEILLCAVTRTGHTQLAMSWIAVAWLATGLYVAPPAISGREPNSYRRQFPVRVSADLFDRLEGRARSGR